MKISNNKLISLAIGVVGLIWCFGMYTISDLHDPALAFGGGVLFALIAIAVSVVYLMFFRHSPGRQAVEVGALSIYFTLLYFVVTLALNTVLILIQRGGLNKILFLCNLLIIAIYLILTLSAEKTTERLSGQLDYAGQVTSASANISKKLGVLLSVVNDPDLRKRVLSLKEAVDYSSNTTTDRTFETEKQMEAQLDKLINLAANSNDTSAIQDGLRDAETIWKLRSSAASSK